MMKLHIIHTPSRMNGNWWSPQVEVEIIMDIQRKDDLPFGFIQFWTFPVMPTKRQIRKMKKQFYAAAGAEMKRIDSEE